MLKTSLHLYASLLVDQGTCAVSLFTVLHVFFSHQMRDLN